MASNICETCGWFSALISCLSFGSFAVPIKSKRARDCKVDPLVFQSYKTFICFMTSFLTLPLFHQDFYFTPWGIISGLFWVPAGVAAIYAVQNAGLAVSQGIWSSLIVIVSFVWGIAFFDEQVRSEGMAIISIFFMIMGLCGMSYFSSPDETDANRDEIEERARSVCSSVMDEGTGIDADSNTDADSDGNEDGNLTGLEYKGLASEDEFHNEEPSQRNSHHDIIRRRRLGIAAAIFNGVWGGSILVPMQFAPSQASGTGYVISFAIGASIVTILLWVIRVVYLLYQFDMNMVRTYNALPSLHLRIMWLPGGIAGTLWSIGNIASMISVEKLGEGVGYSLTQSSMLVSGLWGIFYFQEVKSKGMKIKWFVSALITLIGIMLLSYEHKQ